MRILLALPLLLATACNVENDPQNDEVTVEYDQNQLENTASDVGNTAENIGGAIVNEVEEAADKVDNSGIVADGDRNGNAAENRQ